MIKIVLFGPESTGKTVLAQKLAAHFHTLWVPEFARAYLDIKREIYDPFGRRSEEICQPQDIPSIVIGQIAQEEAIAAQAKDLIFCDTNPLQTKVYNNYYFSRNDEWLEQTVQQLHYHLYLLNSVDIPWIADGQRDRPDDRTTLFNLFHQELVSRNLTHQIIQGSYETRFVQAIETTEKFLSTYSHKG